jgi:addiction module RelE/StbE family toxin
MLLQSSGFARDLKSWLKTHSESEQSIQQALEQLSADAHAPSLRTHKLRGPLARCWACSAGYDLRIVFEFVAHEGSEAILLLALGTHNEVY